MGGFVMLVILILLFVSNITCHTVARVLASKTNNPNCYRDKIFVELKPPTITLKRERRKRDKKFFLLKALNLKIERCHHIDVIQIKFESCSVFMETSSRINHDDLFQV